MFQLFNAQRLELKNLRARDERAVYIKERIVGRRADEPQISALDVGQQDVLLRFVEMMDLIDEHDRLFSRRPNAIGGGRNHTSHFRDIAFHSAKADKLSLRHFRDDARERRFSGPRRSGENHRRQTIGFNGATQQFSRTENVFLAGKFVERARPHPCGQWRCAVRLFKIDIVGFVEQIVHR